ncbi:hypothetical protein PBY51_022510 [Eleginops maclovinus]|uniref:Uncharacterized protein n=1 Tax=Eleginops maclovinus TaxID=56733 RepID=A0AAN7XHV0_ELEMC|nr:hypothetical protein PBY51_022510 [Eleginops maclovinus]
MSHTAGAWSLRGGGGRQHAAKFSNCQANKSELPSRKQENNLGRRIAVDCFSLGPGGHQRGESDTGKTAGLTGCGFDAEDKHWWFLSSGIRGSSLRFRTSG